MAGDQLDLFGDDARPASTPRPDLEPLRKLAEALPKHVRLGASTWTFPGWAGLVYQRAYQSQRAFVRESLAEYAAYPLFETVGVDRAHYAPLSAPDWQGYAQQLPAGFECVIKAWEELTVMIFPDHERYGARRGQPNKTFLDPALFRDAVAGPLLEGFSGHVGALVLEIAPMRRPPPARELADKLALFLNASARTLPLMVELRNRELLTPRYLAVLRHFGAGHVLNFWTGMPTLREQLAIPGILMGSRAVARLSLPPFTAYAQRKRDFAPFDRIVDPQLGLREDVAQLVDRTGELGQSLFVTVNNKVEGSAPLTIRALAERIVQGRKP